MIRENKKKKRNTDRWTIRYIDLGNNRSTTKEKNRHKKSQSNRLLDKI